MRNGRKNVTVRIAVIGGILVAAILVLGTVWMGHSASHDTDSAVRSVSLLYLDELAGRREQVVEDTLNESSEKIRTAVDLMTEEDLSDEEHLRAYQARMKKLYDLEKFAFVDTEGVIYTSQGTQDNIDDYHFDHLSLEQPEISLLNPESTDRKVIIAVPVDKMLGDRHLTVCFMEIGMKNMLENISIVTQDTGATYCNIYTGGGIPLSDQVLAGAADESSLFDALANAEFMDGYFLDQVKDDFAQGRKGTVSFTYKGTRETLTYAPVQGTDWMLTYLIRESVISERISSVSSGIITRSLIQSLLAALVLGMMFAFIIHQNRKNAKLELEKETTEAENRARSEEMEQRLALQEELLEQKTQQQEQSKLITALASDFRSVYYLELDRNRGVCYQARTDLHGFSTGDEFNYLESVTAYCNKYILEPYREEFLKFIQPDAIREGLKENLVISFRYLINVDGHESWEAVRFAGVRHPEDRADHLVHSVGAGFADVDAETRRALAQQQTLSEALAAAEQASKAKTAFLSNMSHEIRTPMNAIIGLNNIALNEPDVPEKVRGFLTKTGESAQHLLGIINDILDMSRIESGRMVIKNEEFSFAKNLEQVNTIISGQCAEKGLTYDCRMSGKIDDYYIGDGMKLRQVMINILGNAVKFTPEGGTVTFLIEEGPRYNGQATLKMTFKDTASA